MKILAVIILVGCFLYGMWLEYARQRKLRAMAKDVEARNDAGN